MIMLNKIFRLYGGGIAEDKSPYSMLCSFR